MNTNPSRKWLQPFVKYRNISILCFVLIVVGSFLFFRGRMAPSIYVASRDDALQLNCYDRRPLSIPYEDIRTLSQASEFDVGTMVEGFEDNRARCGVWHNEALGDYTLYGLKSLAHYVVVTTADQTVAFNYESDSVTDAIYQSVRDVLDQKGVAYEVS